MPILPAWRHAWRVLVRRPAFFAAAVLTLAFGAGTTTAVFSLVDTVLVKPLPYPDADRLVTVYESSPSSRERTSLIAPARIEDWHRLNRTFVALSGSYGENVTDTSGAEPERLTGSRVAPRFFSVYAMPPARGRFFTEEEERANGPGAAVISDAFWLRRFQRGPSAIGHTLIIGGRSYAIVGVVPATFTAAALDVWLPAQTPPGLMQVRDARFFGGVARLRAGVTVEAAQGDLAAIQSALGREFPKTDAGWSAEVRALKDARIGDARRGLLLVLAAVALLWVITVTNIAGLTLVQVRRRARELALHTALGASRGRVVGAMLREGALVAAGGGVLGMALAYWLVSALPSILTATPRINELALDWRALAFVAGSSLLAVGVFSVVPALAGTRPRLNPLLAGGTRVTAGHHLLQRGIVVGQVALSVVLLASAMLLLRSYANLTRVAVGFDAADALTFHVAARWDEDRARVAVLQERLLAGLEQLPHVRAAGMTNFLPAAGATLRYPVTIAGLAGPNEDGSMTAGSRMISGGYLRAIRAPLVAGALCPNPVTGSRAPLQALVNQRFVDAFAPGQNLVGRTLRSVGSAEFTIAGIVGNLAEDGHAAGAAPYVYTCNRAGSWPDPAYVVRTADPGALAADLRRIVREIDPARAIFGLRELDEILDAALDRPRFDAAMLTLFAAAALLLAAIGQYSLFMLVVSERTREVAVRLAIGAEPRQVIRLVMTGAGRLLAGGVAAGIVLTIAAERLLRGVLFGVSPADPIALAFAVLALVLASTSAAALPALRASRIAPSEVLRGE